MTNYYENVPLEEFEGILANREYWDNASYEWESFSKMEVKLARLGTFVQRGGDLNRVITRYTEDREYRPLEMISDNYPKFVLTRNDPVQKRNGIIHLNIPKLIVEQRKFD